MARSMSDPSSTLVGTPSLDLELGSTLGSYELTGVLGKGAMGCVYRARHVLLGREVAIKVLNAEFVARPDVVDRFFREARVVNEIDHENIVEVTDLVEAPGLAYLVMELLEGVTLRELITQRGRKYPPLKRIVGLMTQVCAALEAAHEKGVVHRDLKPDNVFVVQRNGVDFVKVLDFGVAKLRDPGDHAATTAGLILGTPHYMAPEQALGREVDRRADVWAAGVVLHELLSGVVPFSAPSFVELAMAIREEPPKPMPRKTPRGERVPAWLVAVVLKCLEKRPADRFRSMAALAEALSATRASGRRWTGRAMVAAASLAVAVGAAVAVRTTLQRGALEPRSTPTPTPAHPERSAAAGGAESKGISTSTPAHPERSAAAGGAESKGISTRTPPRTATATAAPTSRSTETPRSPSPASSRSTHHPAAPRGTVELYLRSSPAGAAVIRLDTGQRIGKTPLRVNVAGKEAVVWIQMALDGYQPVKFAVDLRRDNAANVTLRASKSAKGTRR